MDLPEIKKDPKKEKSEAPEKNQNIILVVALPGVAVAEKFVEFKKKNDNKYRIAVIHNAKAANKEEEEAFSKFDIAIICDFDDPKSIVDNLRPYRDELLAVTCRMESRIEWFRKLVPFVPYLRTPTSESLSWSTNKIEMRKRFLEFDKTIAPAFHVVSDAKKKTLTTVEEKVGYPLVVKPSGLAQSLLVSIGYHKEELEKTLKGAFKTINRIYKGRGQTTEPQILVEQQMEGELYSIDAYVDSRGKVTCCPLVAVKTGRAIGFDDFFGYQQMTPANVKKESIAEAEEAVRKAVHALGLRSTTAHVELMRTEEGWKIVEVGPRIGGFRDVMYRLSYGIDHTENDIFTRIPKTVSVPQKIKGYTVAFKFFAKKEGKITTLTGIKKAQQLKSFHSITINKKIGDKAVFAKNGGTSIFNMFLFNEDRSKLLADIRRLEQMIKIETE
ncbi:MAG TPA: ATP-grasp domain-containing protein [Candidatus Paceibacterota bacterium]|nr:ATP-grasp domain-containing protein [Candidatus Paceibacterota bacterium]